MDPRLIGGPLGRAAPRPVAAIAVPLGGMSDENRSPGRELARLAPGRAALGASGQRNLKREARSRAFGVARGLRRAPRGSRRLGDRANPTARHRPD